MRRNQRIPRYRGPSPSPDTAAAINHSRRIYCSKRGSRFEACAPSIREPDGAKPHRLDEKGPGRKPGSCRQDPPLPSSGNYPAPRTLFRANSFSRRGSCGAGLDRCMQACDYTAPGECSWTTHGESAATIASSARVSVKPTGFRDRPPIDSTATTRLAESRFVAVGRAGDLRASPANAIPPRSRAASDHPNTWRHHGLSAATGRHLAQ
jgi:hypothetical protein